MLARFEGGIDAKLIEQPEGIPDHVRFQDFSVGDLMDGDAIDGHFFVARREAEKFALMRASDGPDSDDFPFFADGLVHREAQVGKAVEEQLHLTPVHGRPDRRSGYAGIIQGVALRKQLIDEAQLAPIPYLAVEPFDHVLVRCRHGGDPPSELKRPAQVGMMPCLARGATRVGRPGLEGETTLKRAMPQQRGRTLTLQVHFSGP